MPSGAACGKAFFVVLGSPVSQYRFDVACSRSIMRIRYTIPFKRNIFIDDHGEVPFQGGLLRVIDENGFAKALVSTSAKVVRTPSTDL